eukprot:490943-Rhodomonas_salina.2
MPITEIGCLVPRRAHRVPATPPPWSQVTSTICLRVQYGVSSIDIAYDAARASQCLCAWYAMSGTDIAYGA